MQDRVRVETAQKFATTFYQQLLQDGQVDLACNEARSTLLTAQLPGAAIPVLFMRLRTGQLFASAEDARLRIPFMVEELKGFVSRPAELDQLTAHLLDKDGTPRAVTVGLQGFGGYGKTTLARAICHDERVWQAFRDGILWVTLGQNPSPADLIGRIEDLIHALTGGRPEFASLEAATPELVKALGERQLLLVIDDVWNAAHLEPFTQGGPCCTRLITTRDTSTLPPDTLGVDVGAMQPSEAEDMLSAGLPPGDPEALRQLAARLGEWPLLLNLVNGALREQIGLGLTADEALAYVNEGLTEEGLTVFDATDAVARDQAVASTVGVSLALLSEDERFRYGELAIFPEDVDIPLVAVERLWGATGSLKSFRVKKLCTRLFRLSLLLAYDATAQTIRLHDVLREYLQRAEETRLAGVHGRFLGTYALERKDNLWHTLPDDGYIHAYLTWHMERAEQVDQIHALLREETAEGRNGWYQAHDRLGQAAAYVTDVTRAWRLAEEEFSVHRSPLAIGLQCRCALIVASVNSVAENVHPALLVALVEKKIWSPVQGLTYARRSPDLKQRAEALARLAPHLPEAKRAQVLREALAAAWEIENEQQRAAALVGLAPHLPELLLRETLAAAQEIEDERCRTEALAGLGPCLPEAERAQVLQEALVTARKSMGEEWGVAVLAKLAPHLPEAERAQVLRAALTAATELWHESMQARTLKRLAPHLPESLLREALSAAWEIEDEVCQYLALVELIPRLAQLGYPEQALAAAQEIQHEFGRAQALTGLAPHLPEAERAKVLREALEAARELKFDMWRVELLATLVPYLPDAERAQALQEALVAAQKIVWVPTRIEALARLAPHLPELLLREALAAAREDLMDERGRAETLARLALHLPEAKRAQALLETLVEARTIRYSTNWAKMVATLAPHLPELPLLAALAVAYRIPEGRDSALAELIPRLAQLGYPEQALAAAREIVEDEVQQAKTLAELLPHLPETERAQVLRETLAVTREIKAKGEQAFALAGLIPHLPEAERTQVLREALAAAWEIENGRQQALALAKLAPHLPELLLREALAAAWEIENEEREALAAFWEIENEERQALVLASLIPRLAELGCPEEALAAALKIRYPIERAEALRGLAPHLPELLLRDILATTREIVGEEQEPEKWGRAKALARLVLRLAELGYPEEALAAAQEIEDEWWQAMTLAGLVPHLPEAERAQVLRETLAAAREIVDGGWWETSRTVSGSTSWVQVLAELAPHLAQLSLADLAPPWQETLTFLAIHIRRDLMAGVRSLAPVIAALGGEEAVTETFRAIQDVGRWWP